MELVTPPIGLLFWMCLSFGIVVWLLSKYAWKPILGAVQARERSIEDALSEARKMREEMAKMAAGNEELMRQAREDREVLLKEARDIRDREIAQARTKAKAEADALLGRAREDIRNEKNAAMTEMKNQVAELSVQVAETILRDKLGSNVAQEVLVDKVMRDAELRRS
jgi:F-type H+-transporting ATPase subunit b